MTAHGSGKRPADASSDAAGNPRAVSRVMLDTFDWKQILI